MKITTFYPVVMVSSVEEASRFFVDTFNFSPVITSQAYVHLRHANFEDLQLALIDRCHESIPEVCRDGVVGLVLTLEVEDIDCVAEAIRRRGVELLQDIRDEPFGQRHFIIRGPEGLLFDIVAPIQMDYEHAIRRH